MECEVQSMATSDLSEDVKIPEGKVEAVCKEWVIREDGMLAYKLQSEEIQHHYGHNKERNQLVRSDFHEARNAQKDEEEEAEMIRKAHESWLKELEDRDAFIAQQLQDTILKEDLDRQREIEERDKHIALEFQRKERLRLQRKREEREMRQAERARLGLPGVSNSSSVRSIEDVQLTQEAATSPLEKDFSEMSFNPPAGLSQEELRRFREHYDAELAKMLQEQEMKSNGHSNLDRQIAIEAQDRELAKVLQEQERAKARKVRERARQKAMMQQQQQQEQMNTIEKIPLHYAVSPDHDENGVNQKERLKNSEWYLNDRRGFTSDFSGDPVNNIAAAIDPTFSHKKSSLPSPSVSQISSPSSPLSSPNSEVPPYSVSGANDGFFMSSEDSESAAPPYMPIQGTRRTTSLEKGKKGKKNRDNCKTQ